MEAQRDHTVDILYGVLSVGIVYLHSSYANGFSINDFGTNIYIVKQVTGLFYLTFVPMFFIMYGYLSYGSFFSSEGNWSFLRRKIPRFLPLYMSFLLVDIVRQTSFWETLTPIKIFLAFLGLYHETGITGGHIVFVVNMAILTRLFFHFFNLTDRGLAVFLVLIALVSNYFIQRPAEFFVFKYFGYYVAVIFGVWLKKFEVMDERQKTNIALIFIMVAISLLVPILNLQEIYFLEINYSPNSIEQIVLSGTVLLICYISLRKFSPNIPEFFKKILSDIGKKSFAHFIIHIYVISLLINLGSLLDIPNVIVQFVIIMTVSVISIYVIYPIWEYFFKAFSSLFVTIRR